MWCCGVRGGVESCGVGQTPSLLYRMRVDCRKGVLVDPTSYAFDVFVVFCTMERNLLGFGCFECFNWYMDMCLQCSEVVSIYFFLYNRDCFLDMSFSSSIFNPFSFFLFFSHFLIAEKTLLRFPFSLLLPPLVFVKGLPLHNVPKILNLSSRLTFYCHS